MNVVTKPKKTERQKQIKRCDDLASEIVRRRAIGRSGGCEKCLRPKYDIQKEDGSVFSAWKRLQCAHCISRTKFAVRWDLDNMAGLCSGCHRFIDRNQEAKDMLFNELLGEQGLIYLKGRDRYSGKTDLDLIELYLREKLRELNDH